MGNFEVEKGSVQDMPDMSGGRCTQSDSAEGSTGTVRILVGEYKLGVHIGDTRRIRYVYGDIDAAYIVSKKEPPNI